MVRSVVRASAGFFRNGCSELSSCEMCSSSMELFPAPSFAWVEIRSPGVIVAAQAMRPELKVTGRADGGPCSAKRFL